MQKINITEIIIGSNNEGKIKEIRDLLPQKIKIYSPKDFKLKSPKENGKTFAKNSLIKARFFSKKTGKSCIADGQECGITVKDYMDFQKNDTIEAFSVTSTERSI